MAGFLGAFGGLALAACGATPLGASDIGIAQARAKAPPGADAYDHSCASCHGKRGEGLSSAPALMGASALPKYPREENPPTLNPTLSTNPNIQQDTTRVTGQGRRGVFVTAQDVFNFVSTRMPLPRPSAGSLKPEEYWVIVNYLLIANQIAVPTEGVTPANAKDVSIQR